MDRYTIDRRSTILGKPERHVQGDIDYDIEPVHKEADQLAQILALLER